MYISHIVMSQQFMRNLRILEGCNHMNNALAGVKKEAALSST